MPRPGSLTDCPGPRQAIAGLCAPLGGFDESMLQVDPVEPPAMPAWANQLLVHQRHMTRVLEAAYGAKVDLYVMRYHLQQELYTRKIFLTVHHTARAVEYGVVRLDLRCLSEAVRQQVLQRRAPLGSILIRHNVLRRIEPRWFVRLPAHSALRRWFGAPARQELFGRVGIIWCDDRPAIELFEVVMQPPGFGEVETT